jgi:hypothetical protein
VEAEGKMRRVVFSVVQAPVEPPAAAPSPPPPAAKAEPKRGLFGSLAASVSKAVSSQKTPAEEHRAAVLNRRVDAIEAIGRCVVCGACLSVCSGVMSVSLTQHAQRVFGARQTGRREAQGGGARCASGVARKAQQSAIGGAQSARATTGGGDETSGRGARQSRVDRAASARQAEQSCRACTAGIQCHVIITTTTCLGRCTGQRSSSQLLCCNRPGAIDRADNSAILLKMTSPLTLKLASLKSQIDSTLSPLLSNARISQNSTAEHHNNAKTARQNLPNLCFVLSNEVSKLSIFFQNSKKQPKDEHVLKVLELVERALVSIDRRRVPNSISKKKKLFCFDKT